jgi:hypothetical protein
MARGLIDAMLRIDLRETLPRSRLQRPCSTGAVTSSRSRMVGCSPTESREPGSSSCRASDHAIWTQETDVIVGEIEQHDELVCEEISRGGWTRHEVAGRRGSPNGLGVWPMKEVRPVLRAHEASAVGLNPVRARQDPPRQLASFASTSAVSRIVMATPARRSPASRMRSPTWVPSCWPKRRECVNYRFPMLALWCERIRM